MERIGSVVMLCIWLGALTVCTILVISGILRWLADAKERDKRLNSAAWVAVAVLFIMLLVHCRGDLIDLFGSGGSSSQLTAVIVNVSKITAKLLILGTVLACAVSLLFFVFLFVRYGLSIIVRVKSGNTASLIKDLSAKSDELITIMKTPILMMAITFGILAMFIIIPLLMAEQDSSEQSLPKTWQDGVQQVAAFGDPAKKQKGTAEPGLDETTTPESEDITALAPEESDGKEKDGSSADSTSLDFSKSLITYILIFIIVLGIGFAVTQILYSIIRDCSTKKNAGGIIDEYSGSIGILAVGISILWSIKNDALKADSMFEMIAEFGRSFITVMIIITLGILTLEMIRLIMDMKEKLIRLEAKYLFVSLVGLSTMLLLSLLISAYEAVSAAIGNNTSAEMYQLQEKIKCKIINEMDCQLDKKRDYKMTFSGFREKVTKK